MLKDKADGVRLSRLQKPLFHCDHCKQFASPGFSMQCDPYEPILPGDGVIDSRTTRQAIFFCLGCGYNLAAAIRKACQEWKE